MSRLVFLDCETTGLNPDQHVPWEIAYIVRESGWPDREVIHHLKPCGAEMALADPKGLEICGFHERTADPRFSWGEWRPVRRALLDDLAGAHLVGNVISFDAEMIARNVLFEPWPRPWHYHLIDVEALAIGALTARGASVSLPWNSDEISAQLGVIPPQGDDRHTALADARWARDVYDAVMGGAK
jgi:DNA polymerase III epsilon subunit-like protein